MNKTLSYILILAMLVAASVFSINLFFRQKSSHDKTDITKFPYEISGWKGKDIEVGEYAYKLLETRNLISREYKNPSGESVYLFIIWSEANRSVFHPPEVCMIGSDIEIADKQTEKIDMPGNSFFVNKLYISKNSAKDIVLYCYKTDDLYTDNFYLQQASFAFRQIFSKNVKGATIRVSMPITQKGEEYTLATLKAFLEKTINIVDGL
ncbi:MAG: EpsI family protein [Candidatus Omnitrophica bacterium]|nr:EpsI family protein [Candidatus Omnitrophota bacterium]